MPEGITKHPATGALTISAEIAAQWRIRYESSKVDRLALASQTSPYKTVSAEGAWQDTEDELIHLLDDMFTAMTDDAVPAAVYTEGLQWYRLSRAVDPVEDRGLVVDRWVTARDQRAARAIAAAHSDPWEHGLWLDPEFTTVTVVEAHPARVVAEVRL
jgi:hypothetical protein